MGWGGYIVPAMVWDCDFGCKSRSVITRDLCLRGSCLQMLKKLGCGRNPGLDFCIDQFDTVPSASPFITRSSIDHPTISKQYRLAM